MNYQKMQIKIQVYLFIIVIVIAGNKCDTITDDFDISNLE